MPTVTLTIPAEDIVHAVEFGAPVRVEINIDRVIDQVFGALRQAACDAITHACSRGQLWTQCADALNRAVGEPTYEVHVAGTASRREDQVRARQPRKGDGVGIRRARPHAGASQQT